jgi:uncharacterized protein (DUF433 family)
MFVRGDYLDFIDRIEINPRVCNGRPVVKETRIPISVILEQIAEGESWETILRSAIGG